MRIPVSIIITALGACFAGLAMGAVISTDHETMSFWRVLALCTAGACQ